MDKNIERAFERFDKGDRPWRLVKKNWYVANSSGELYPLKYIWALVINEKPRDFNTRDARVEFVSRKYSIVNINEVSPKKAKKNKTKKYDKKPKKKLVLTIAYDRNPEVVSKVLERANGICEMCNKKAPFVKAKDGLPYLEVHHKVQLSNDGDDTVENAIALCPNCHRKEHYGE